MEKWEIRPPLKKEWTDRHLNLHVSLRRGPLPPCKISSRYDYPFRPPNTRNFASSDSASFFWFFCQPTAKRPLHRFSQSIRQMTSFRARMCLLGVPKTKFYILTPFSPKTQFFGQFSMGLWKFRVKKVLTMGMLESKVPLIVIVAPWKLNSE